MNQQQRPSQADQSSGSFPAKKGSKGKKSFGTVVRRK
jgi:hypothetical protein